MITGVRRSGKTVMLTDISKHFKNEKDWIVIELNPDRDMLQGFASAFQILVRNEYPVFLLITGLFSKIS